MRATLAAALGIIALSGLSGCDELGLGSSHKRVVQAPAPSCNCVTAPAPAEHLARLAPPPAVKHHHYNHVRRESSHAYSQSWAEQYAEPQMPSYSSESHTYYEGEESHAAHEHVWVDGYGRAHDTDQHVTRVAAAGHDRLDPYHAYKSKCGDKERE